ncbi:hypothetical protein PO878_15325 [Iamia majanohamensis]|uniref:Uncharacterized protein n=1 Tax=Iamia majanohamensis TaxID=467976 RepID=A0AAF0BUA2_9ACTN|nr:hypothetical protein [Iamia majanohamensis]WCO65873.1 hypothetical protein PO878_15325 [Iamia majanohamensis]
MAAQGPADVLTAPAPADRSTPAGARRVRVAWSVGVWALAAWAPVLQAAGFGERQRVGSVLLGLCLLALSACVVALPVSPVARGLASLGPMAMAVLVSTPALGRGPALVGIGCTLLAAEALRQGRLGWAEPDGPVVRGVPVAVGTLLVGVVWWASQSPALSAVALAAVAALASWARRDPASLDALDRRITPPCRPALRALGRGLDRVDARAREQGRHLTGWARRHPAALVAGGGVALATAPVFLRMARDPSALVTSVNDHTIHLEFARDTNLLPLVAVPPHWLFHVLVGSVQSLVSIEVAATVLLALATGALTVLLCWRAGNAFGSTPGLAPVAAAATAVVAVLAQSPTALLNATGALSPPRAFAPFQAWANPTDTLALPLELGLLVALVALARDDGPVWYRPTALRVAVAGLAVLTVLAKPNLPMILLVAVPLHLAVQRRFRWPTLLAHAAWFAAPVVVVLGAQLRHTATNPEFASRGGEGWGVTVDPFAILGTIGAGQGGVWFWSGTVLLVLGPWVGRRAFLREPLMSLGLLTLVLSLVPMLLLRETGERASDGNYTKAAYHAWMVVVLLTLVFLVQALAEVARRRRAGDPVPLWAPVTLVLLVLTAAGGVAFYLDAVGLPLPGAVYPVLR